jgi:LemA protein
MKSVLIGCGSIAAVFAAILLIVAICLIGSYNGMALAKQEVAKAWGQVENQYQRRADLVPNLVNTVKGYAGHEEKVLREVTEARQQVTKLDVAGIAENPELQKQFLDAQQQMSGALSRLLVTVEAYPNLKADQGFLALQSQLEGTENRVAVERGRYQEAVQAYNARIVTLFGRILSGLFGFKEIEYYKADAGADKAPQVQF